MPYHHDSRDRPIGYIEYGYGRDEKSMSPVFTVAAVEYRNSIGFGDASNYAAAMLGTPAATNIYQNRDPSSASRCSNLAISSVNSSTLPKVQAAKEYRSSHLMILLITYHPQSNRSNSTGCVGGGAVSTWRWSLEQAK